MGGPSYRGLLTVKVSDLITKRIVGLDRGHIIFNPNLDQRLRADTITLPSACAPRRRRFDSGTGGRRSTRNHQLAA